MPKFDKPMTAAELMERLHRNPEWVARDNAKKELERLDLIRSHDEQAPLLKDLKKCGFDVYSVWDLVNTGKSYPEAIPVLIRHLRGNYDAKTREGIARALTNKDAKPFIHELIDAFKEDPDKASNGAKWAIGNALYELADKSYISEIANLALDRSHGKGRFMLVKKLKRSKTQIAREALEKLKDDPDVGILV